MSKRLHIKNMTEYSITKSSLCFLCHGKPDKDQEDLHCCYCCLDNTFLCKKKYIGFIQKSQR